MNITGGEFKGQKIFAPDEKVTRPTLSKIRMAVFNTLQAIMDFEGKSFFDMYAGSGIMGLEALSRGFKTLYACEKDRNSAKILKQNYEKYLKARDIKFFNGDCLKYVQNLKNLDIDVAYLDPPYYSGVYENSLNALKDLAKIIIVEHVTEVDFSDFEIIKQKQYGEKFITFLLNK